MIYKTRLPEKLQKHLQCCKCSRNIKRWSPKADEGVVIAMLKSNVRMMLMPVSDFNLKCDTFASCKKNPSFYCMPAWEQHSCFDPCFWFRHNCKLSEKLQLFIVYYCLLLCLILLRVAVPLCLFAVCIPSVRPSFRPSSVRFVLPSFLPYVLLCVIIGY